MVCDDDLEFLLPSSLFPKKKVRVKKARIPVAAGSYHVIFHTTPVDVTCRLLRSESLYGPNFLSYSLFENLMSFALNTF